MQKTLGVFFRILKSVEGLEELDYARKTTLTGWQKLLSAVVELIGRRIPPGDSVDEGDDD